MSVIGFTGTRVGLSEGQRSVVESMLARYQGGELHHGDCIGADAQVHEIALRFGMKVVIHPPLKREFRAFCKGGSIRGAKSYDQRNRDIVNACDILIACPLNRNKRSGTVSTIDYAERIGKTTWVIPRKGQLPLTAFFRPVSH